ncbi:hypothetical protein [Streptomyces sp. NPDC127190]|uniref:hypothetical protein n=1 Tax=unclassified Streptomyces TaxID=2593676 RepID=UPI00362B99C8
MKRKTKYGACSATAMLLAMVCAACGSDGPSHGAAALKNSCDGVVDAEAIKEARHSENFSRAYDASTTKQSHASAARAVAEETHAAYVCQVRIDGASPSAKNALSIKFEPALQPLFPERQKNSYPSYSAYKLGYGMQATSGAGEADVFFTCQRTGENKPLLVTGILLNDLDLSENTQFRIIFHSAEKMTKLLKCTNKIAFPSAVSMKPLPLMTSG